MKKSFEQKFKLDPEAEEEKQSEEQPNHFRPNFNMPQTMRGIKNIALGIKTEMVLEDI